MKAETADYLAKARATLADAEKIAAVPLPHVAAREAYYAAYHAPRHTSSSRPAKWRSRIEACAASSVGWPGANPASTASLPVFLRPPTS
jgi:hypothetical protein